VNKVVICHNLSVFHDADDACLQFEFRDCLFTEKGDTNLHDILAFFINSLKRLLPFRTVFDLRRYSSNSDLPFLR